MTPSDNVSDGSRMILSTRLDRDRYEVKTGEVQGNLWERCTVTRAISYFIIVLICGSGWISWVVGLSVFGPAVVMGFV